MAKSKNKRLTARQIDQLIHRIRDHKVMLDSDIAQLYGVTTSRLNEQRSRNKDRFPEDFAFQLTAIEYRNLMSQIAISSSEHGGRRKRPWVFTEQGVAMLSSVLRAPNAIRVNIEIMRAFVRIRRLLSTPGALVEQLQQLAKTVELHDRDIRTISQVLEQMITAPTPDERRIGFSSK